MSTDVATKCRTCMLEDSASYHLYDVFENQSILEILDQIVPQIHIMEESPFSNLICRQCLDKLITAYKFQQLCIDTSNYLHNTMVGIAPQEAANSEIVDCWETAAMGEKELPIKVETDGEELCYFEINTEVDVQKCDNVLEGNGESGTDDNTGFSRKGKRNCLKKFQNSAYSEQRPLLLQRRQTHKKGIANGNQRENESVLLESPLPTERNKVTCPQTQRIEKFQYTSQRFEEPMQDIEDSAEWNNREDNSVDSEHEYYSEYNDAYCEDRGGKNMQSSSRLSRSKNSKTLDDDNALLVPLFEEGEMIIKSDSDDSVSTTPEEKSSQKRVKKLTPKIMKWIDMFAKRNPRITIKNMQRKLFDEKNEPLSLSTIYCGMRKLKAQRRMQRAESAKDGEVLDQSEEERETAPRLAQFTEINIDNAKSTIAQYRQKFEAMEERRRPKKLTPEILELLAFFAERNPRITTKIMQKTLSEEKNIILSLSTIYCGMRVLRVGVGEII